MKHFQLFILATLIASTGFAQGIDFQHEDWAGIKKQARKSDKIIFVDAYTTWCGPCKWMAAEVFTDPAVADFYNDNFINVKLDMEKGEGLEFAKEYEVNAYPTLLFLDGKGKLVHKRLGAIPAEMFVEFGHEAMDPSRRIGTLMAKYDKGNREPEFLQAYISRMLAAGMDAGEAAETYFGSISESELITSENFELIQMMRPSMDDPKFRAVLNNQEAFANVVTQEAVDQYLKETCLSGVMRALHYGEDGQFEKVIKEVASFKLKFSDEIMTYAYMNQAQREGDYENFIDYTKKYAKSYAWDNWEVLNSIAWGIYEDEEYETKAYLGLGLKLVKQSVKLDENYFNTDTYAALLYKNGDYDHALKWGEKAVTIAKSKNMDYGDTSKLIDKIKEAMQ